MELIDVEQFRLGGTGKASAAGTLLPPPSINTSPPSGSHQTSQRLFVKGPIPLGSSRKVGGGRVEESGQVVSDGWVVEIHKSHLGELTCPRRCSIKPLCRRAMSA